MSLGDLLKNYKYDSEFIYEGLLLDISYQLKLLMEEKGVSKKELAKRMGVKPSYITKIFGGANISLKTIAKILAALKVDATLTISKRENKLNSNFEFSENIMTLLSPKKGEKSETKEFSSAA